MYASKLVRADLNRRSRRSDSHAYRTPHLSTFLFKTLKYFTVLLWYSPSNLLFVFSFCNPPYGLFIFPFVKVLLWYVPLVIPFGFVFLSTLQRYILYLRNKSLGAYFFYPKAYFFHSSSRFPSLYTPPYGLVNSLTLSTNPLSTPNKPLPFS